MVRRFFQFLILLTRQTVFFEDEWFKKAAKIQTGVRLKYFTEFNLPAYDPVLAEFYVQSEESLGAFPLVDSLLSNQNQTNSTIFDI